MEDIRLMRQCANSEAIIAVANAAVQIVAQDSTRVALTIQNIGANALWAAFTNAVLKQAGMVFPVNGQPLVLDIQQHGTLVTRQWFAISDVALASIMYVQSITLAGP